MLLFKKSSKRNKKYMVCFERKWIHFGDRTKQQYEDRTPLKLYSHLNHFDSERRKAYLRRSLGITRRDGSLTWNDPHSANYYSRNYLW